MQTLKNFFKKSDKPKSSRGDTLIEVAFALAGFSLVTIIIISIMNSSLEMMQGTLELTMTRNEIDAQAEALRFIQNSYLSERELIKDSSSTEAWREYKKIWERLTDIKNGLNNNPTKISAFNASACSVYYTTGNAGQKDHNIFDDRAFIINTRNLDPENVNNTIISAKDTTGAFNETPLYPRVIFKTASGTTNENANLNEDDTSLVAPLYDQVARAEGIWIIATRDVTAAGDGAKGASDTYLASLTPEFFDFYIRGCWYAPGYKRSSTISTIVRLYNPEYIQND